MGNRKTLLFTLLLTISFFISAEHVCADAYSFGSVEINTIGLSGSSGIAYQFAPSGHGVGTHAQNSLGEYDDNYDSISAEASVLSASARAEGSGTGYLIKAESDAFSDTVGFSASSDAYRGEQSYLYPATDSITWTAMYEINLNSYAQTPNDISLTSVMASLHVTVFRENEEVFFGLDSVELLSDFYTPNSITDTIYGSLSVSFDCIDGDYVLFGVGASSESYAATTPIPSSLLLLATGLLGLVKYRKR